MSDSCGEWNQLCSRLVSKDQSYVGMLDFRDLVDFVLLVSQAKGLEPMVEGEHANFIGKIVDLASAGTDVPVKDFQVCSSINSSSHSRFVKEESILFGDGGESVGGCH